MPFEFAPRPRVTQGRKLMLTIGHIHDTGPHLVNGVEARVFVDSQLYRLHTHPTSSEYSNRA